MKLKNEQINIIKKHVIDCYPEEAVIGITQDSAIPFDNVHPSPTTHFKIKANEFYKNNCIALVHSHTVLVGDNHGGMSYFDPRAASPADITLQNQMDVPFGICAIDDSGFVTDIVWFPDYDGEMYNQPYVYGVNDCYSVIQKYYWQNYDIKLPTYPSNWAWWETNDDLYAANVFKEGFVEILEQDLQVGDLVFMKISTQVENHAAIYLGGDKILHHLNNRLSGVDSFSRWRKKATRFFRHENLINR